MRFAAQAPKALKQNLLFETCPRPVLTRVILRYFNWKDRARFQHVCKQGQIALTLEAFQQPITLSLSTGFPLYDDVLWPWLLNRGLPQGIRVKKILYDEVAVDLAGPDRLVGKIDVTELTNIIWRGPFPLRLQRACNGSTRLTHLDLMSAKNINVGHFVSTLPALTELTAGKNLSKPQSTSLRRLTWDISEVETLNPRNIQLPNLTSLIAQMGISSYSPSTHCLNVLLQPSTLPRLQELRVTQYFQWSVPLATAVHRLVKVGIDIDCTHENHNWWQWQSSHVYNFFSDVSTSNIQHLILNLVGWAGFYFLDQLVHNVLGKFPLLEKVDFWLDSCEIKPEDLLILLRHHAQRLSRAIQFETFC